MKTRQKHLKQKIFTPIYTDFRNTSITIVLNIRISQNLTECKVHIKINITADNKYNSAELINTMDFIQNICVRKHLHNVSKLIISKRQNVHQKII